MKRGHEENIAWRYEEPTPLIRQVFEKGIIKPGDRVLDVGCGFGRNSNWLESEGCDVVAVNVNEEELNEAKAKALELGLKVEYVRADAVELPFKDGSFDSIVDSGCSHQLNAQEQNAAMKEFNRVLKPGGYIIYFGFSKKHPAARNSTNQSQYRNLDEVLAQIGKDYKLAGSQQIEWIPNPEEKANFDKHIGLNALFRKK